MEDNSLYLLFVIELEHEIESEACLGELNCNGCVSIPGNVLTNGGITVSEPSFYKSRTNAKVVLVETSEMGGEHHDDNGLKFNAKIGK